MTSLLLKGVAHKTQAPSGAQLTRNLWFKGLGRFPNKLENAQICRSRNERFSHMARHKHCLRLLSQQGLWTQMHCLPRLYQIWHKTGKQCICIYKCEKPSIPLPQNEWFFCLLRRSPKPRWTQSFGLRLRDSSNRFSTIYSSQQEMLKNCQHRLSCDRLAFTALL